MTWQNLTEALLRLAASLILLQTLWFKFTGAPESVWIFTQLGVEPWARILSGIAEAIAAGLLLSGRTSLMGAVVALPLMLAAMAAHVFFLGIAVHEDEGLLFMLAVFVFLVSALIIFRQREGLKRLLLHPWVYLRSL